MSELAERKIRDDSGDSVRVGGVYYMNFIRHCREEGEDGSNYHLAMALSALKDTEQQRDAAIRRAEEAEHRVQILTIGLEEACNQILERERPRQEALAERVRVLTEGLEGCRHDEIGGECILCRNPWPCAVERWIDSYLAAAAEPETAQESQS